jgi:hypothetical protein
MMLALTRANDRRAGNSYEGCGNLDDSVEMYFRD